MRPRLDNNSDGRNVKSIITSVVNNNAIHRRRFGMRRRDVMNLRPLAIPAMTPGAAMAGPDRNRGLLKYRVFTVTRPGLNRDVPPGKESLSWVANSATLIYGEQD